MTLGVDVGGTFTDLVRWDGAELRVAKVPTTPDQSEAVAAAAVTLTPTGPDPLLVHGTTVATNALLERAGARTVLVADEGFEDLVEIGRQDRPSLYDPAVDRPAPLVPRDRRVGWGPSAVEAVAALHPAAVAVALRYAFADPAVEQAVTEALAPLGVPVSVSHQVAPEFREFERTSTTVVNAYLRPVTDHYLRLLDRRVVPALATHLLVMRSSGGLIGPTRAAELPAAILLSGPAGGVVAAAALGAALGRRRVVSFDMGGTSTDVCRIEHGRPEVGYQRAVDGQVVRMPSVAVHTVGAGGGSIGWVDAGGAVRVGPQSAGAHPGPACYGQGGMQPTVTDAHVGLGRIDPGGRLAGSVALDGAAARAALERLGAAAGLDAVEAALGMVEVVEARMERAVRAVSVEEGADPASAVLVAFGGAGGLHATALARRLEMAAVVVPPWAGVFSALGLLLAPPRQDRWRSVLVGVAGVDRLDATLAAVAGEAEAALRADSGTPPERVETTVDARYLGQAHETSVVYRPGEGWARLAERFHLAHAERNGFARWDDPVEAVTVRAAAVGRPALTWADLPEHRPLGASRRGTRVVLTGSGPVEATVWRRPGLAAGDEVVGPAVVEDDEATVWLAHGERGILHPSGALEVEW